MNPEVLIAMANMIGQSTETKPVRSEGRWIDQEEIERDKQLEKKARAKRLQAKKSRRRNRK